MSFDVIAAGGVGWVPVSDAEEDALAGAAVLQRIGAEQPVADAVLDAGGLHMPWPIANIEMKARIQQRTRRRCNKLHVHVLRGACGGEWPIGKWPLDIAIVLTNNAEWKLAQAAEFAYQRRVLIASIINGQPIVGTMLVARPNRPYRAGHHVLASAKDNY